MSLPPITFTRLRFSLTPRRDLRLPPDYHPGALVRDHFGTSLKHVACHQPWHPCGETCALPGRCAFGRLFAPQARDEKEGPPSRDLYRPFILEPPEVPVEGFTAETTLQLDMVLIGKAREEIRVVVSAFEEMARHGLGAGRQAWQLARITTLDGASEPETPIYEGATGQFVAPPPESGTEKIIAEAERLSQTEIEVELLTPLRLQQRRMTALDLPFSVWAQAQVRRADDLARDWCDAADIPDRAPMLEHWQNTIELTCKDLRWERWSRGHIREDRLALSGWRGTLGFRGDLSEFRSWLALGEILHVGKQTGFGLGKYQCR